MQNVSQNKESNTTKDVNKVEVGEKSVKPSKSPVVENSQMIAAIHQNFITDLSASEEDEVSEVESFILDQEELEDGEPVPPDVSKFLLSGEGVEGGDLRTVDPETQARLEALLEAAETFEGAGELGAINPETQVQLHALLEAAGIRKLSTADGKAFADPEVLRRLTSSVSCALDEAAAALTRMRAEQQGAGQVPEGPSSLAEACSEGDIRTVRKLLDEGRSVHETTEEGESLLSLACSAGYYELAQVLLAMRANVEDRGIKGDCTPLMEAASGGYVDIVRLLLAHGADVNAQSSAGMLCNTPLHYAACGGYEDVVRVLIEAGANVEEHNENGHTPLMEAASAGHVGVARILLDSGAGINTHSNEFKESALTLACYKGHLEMVKFLLEAGADQEHKTDEMHTALMEASMDGHVEVARLLLDSGAQVNMPADSFESPLTLAACGGHVELANLLIERGANLEEVNDEGYTPLMEAAREGHEEMVALLLAHGADINAQTEETQETALTLACCGGFVEVADFLIKAGADMELGCSTPLMEAAQEGHLDLVKYLLKAGAAVHAQTGTGDTALTYACENGHTDVADVLLQSGASLEHESEGGRTPLMKAARAGHLCTVQFLISKGADVNRQTSTNDHTVLSLACAGGHLAVVELLLTHGAKSLHKLKDGSTMLIEAAKGGHTSVVNLLIDYPNSMLAPTPDLTQVSPPDTQVNLNELPRVPMQGLTNVVPPQDPNHVALDPAAAAAAALNLAQPQTLQQATLQAGIAAGLQAGITLQAQGGVPVPQVPGQVNLKDLNLSAKAQEQLRDNMHKQLSKSLRFNAQDLSQIKNSMQVSDLEPDLSYDYEKSYTEDGAPTPPLSLDLDERVLKTSEKCEKLEQFISSMMRRAEMLNTTREEQILKKQQILEELQKVEIELQEKAQQQLLLCAQQRLEQQHLQQVASSPASPPPESSNPNAATQLSLQQQQQLQEQLAFQLQQQQQQLQQQAMEGGLRAPLPLHLAIQKKLEATMQGVMASHPDLTQPQMSLEAAMMEVQLPALQHTLPEVLAGELQAHLARQESLGSPSQSLGSPVEGEGVVVPPREARLEPSDGAESEDSGVGAGQDNVSSDSREEAPDGGGGEGSSVERVVRAGSEEVDLTNVVPAVSSSSPSSGQPHRPPTTHPAARTDTPTTAASNKATTSTSPSHASSPPPNQPGPPEHGHTTTTSSGLQPCGSHSHPPPDQGSVATPVPGGQPDLGGVECNALATPMQVAQSQSGSYVATSMPGVSLHVTPGTQQPGMLIVQQNGQNQQIIMPQGQVLSSSSVSAVTSTVLQSSLQQAVSLGLLDTTAALDQQLSQQQQTLQAQLALQQQLQQELQQQLKLQQEHQQLQQQLKAQQALTQQMELQHLHKKEQLKLQQMQVQQQQVVSQQQQIATQPPLTTVLQTMVSQHTLVSQPPPLAPSAQQPQQFKVAPADIQHQLKLQQVQQQLQQQLQSSQQLTQQELLQQAQQLQQQLQQAQQLQQLAQQQHLAAQQLAQQQAQQQAGKLQVPALTQQDLLQQAQTLQQLAQQQKQLQQQQAAQAGVVAAKKAKKKHLLPPQGPVAQNHDQVQALQQQQQQQSQLVQTSSYNGFTAPQPAQTGGVNMGSAGLEAITPPSTSTPLTPNPSPASPQVSPPVYPSVDLDSQTESNHDTALTLACAGGHAELVSLLLSRGADIEHRDKKGFTPLILAATAGHTDVVEILLDHGADIEAQSERTKDTPLSLACSGGRYEVVELLLARGANKEHRNVSDYTPLSLAASGGYVNIIKLLLSHGAEINSRTGSKLGISPLMLAAMNGHTAAVKLLLDMGSDINAQIETNRNTALTLACFQGRHEVVSLLVDRKANIEHRAKTGLTPLMEAASGGYVEVGKVLLEKAADVNAPPVPSSRDTALTIAADKGHYRFVELLLAHDAAVDVKNKKGNSPLWLACNGGHLDVVQLLVAAKADIDSQDNRKVSCLMAAFRKGHIKVVKWMVKHVTQFPSDPECMRYIATITDKELLKKCHQCMEMIVSAKDRQAAEANKNASILLEELDQEKSREESKKAAAARKREKRRKKKKEKQEKEKQEKGKENSKNSSPEPEGDDDDDEDTKVNGEAEPPRIIAEPVVPPPNVAKVRSKKEVVESRVMADETSQQIQQVQTPPSESSATTNNNNKPRNKRNRKERDRGSSEKRVPPAAPTPLGQSAAKPSSTSPAPSSNSSSSSETVSKKTRPSTDALSSGTGIGDLDDFNVPPTIKVTPKEKEKNRKNASGDKNSRVSSLDTFGVPLLSPGKNTTTKSPGAPSPKKGQKKEEGWKEVTRSKPNCRTKKVTVPSTAISRVIGRGGCNINAIREVSTAHIEVDKQKGSGERYITIKGSAEASKQAHSLITALIKDPDRDLDTLLPRGSASVRSTGKAQPPAPTAAATTTTTNTDTFTASVWHNSMANNIPVTTLPATTVAAAKAQIAKLRSTVSSGSPSAGSGGLIARTSANNVMVNIGTFQIPVTSPWSSAPQQQTSTLAQVHTTLSNAQQARVVSRQLFPNGSDPQQLSSTAVPPGTGTGVPAIGGGLSKTATYTTASMTQTMLVQAANSTFAAKVDTKGSGIAKGVQPKMSASIQPSNGMVGGPVGGGGVPQQPLPIKSAAPPPGTSQAPPPPQVSTPNHPEFSPFNNLFSNVGDHILGNKKDGDIQDGRMNFASVAAAGVVPQNQFGTPGRPRPLSETEPDPDLPAKAPGYKHPSQRTSSPQVGDHDLAAKAPGYKSNMGGGSQPPPPSHPALGDQFELSRNHPAFRGIPMPHYPMGGVPMETDPSRAPGFRLNPGGPIGVDIDGSRSPGHRPSSAPVSNPNLSPRSSQSQMPGQLSPRGIGVGSHGGFMDAAYLSSLQASGFLRDEYSMPNQPMTLPKIESTLNPHAPNFTSRSLLPPGHPAMRGMQGMHQGMMPPPHPPLSTSPPPLNLLPTDTQPPFRIPPPPQGYSGGFLPSGLGDFGAGVPGFGAFMGAALPQSFSHLQHGPGGDAQSAAAAGKEDGSPGPPVSSEGSPMSSSAPSPPGGVSEPRLPRPIGTERAHRKPAAGQSGPGATLPGLGALGDAAGAELWAYGPEVAGDWMSGVSSVITTSVMTSSVIGPPIGGGEKASGHVTPGVFPGDAAQSDNTALSEPRYEMWNNWSAPQNL